MERTPAEIFRLADEVFDAALDHEPGERRRFVERTCAEDPVLRAAVLRLLEAEHRAGNFLVQGAEAIAAPLIRATAEEGPGLADPQPRRIGPYRIIGEIGRGGMGVVFLAERDDPHFRQRVALKVVRADPLPDRSGAARRFIAERQLLASLEHPHIARLYDGGVTTDGLPYYTMEYCEGGSLADRLATRGPIPAGEAIPLARQLAEALAAAHALGVVHRDVKPANVLFDGAGRVRLTDFGVAKLADGDATRSGVVPGTVAYLAPEQVSGGDADHRADLWAFGVTLYEMLAGRRPFAGPSYAAVVLGIVGTEPEPLALRDPVSPALERLVRRLLHKDPAERPQSAEEVLRELDAAAGASTGPAPDVPRMPQRASRHRVLLGGVLAVAGAAGGLALLSRGSGNGDDAPPAVVAAPSPAAASVAVLPFANTSGDPANEHFSDGLTDELIGALGRVGGLKVVGRTSVFALRGRGLDVRTIGDTLGVATVLEGSVRRADGRLRVGAQLVRARDGTILWSERYDRGAEDVFALQEEITRAIVAALRVRLLRPGDRGALAARQAADPAVYDLYLRGRHIFHTRVSREGAEQAALYFRRAIALDPGYAPAHAGVADAHVRMAIFGYGRPAEEFPRARAAAERALQLDSTLAEARAALAHILLVYDLDWVGAEREFRRALALDPGYGFARVPFAIALSSQGRFPEAIAQLDTARTLDPLAAPVSNVLGRVYVSAGKPDSAILHLRAALELAPDLDLADQQLGYAYLQKGMAAEAIASFEKAAALRGARDSAHLAYAYAATGRGDEASRIVRALVGSSGQRYLPPYHVAVALAGLGDRDGAFHWLDRAYRERGSYIIGVRTEPGFAALRSDPRWPRLLRRMGLDR
jgi:serine/threonine-protein kinase